MGDRSIELDGRFVGNDTSTGLAGMWIIRRGNVVYVFETGGAGISYFVSTVQVALSDSHEPSRGEGLVEGGLYDLLPSQAEMPPGIWFVEIERAPRIYGPIPAPDN